MLACNSTQRMFGPTSFRNPAVEMAAVTQCYSKSVLCKAAHGTKANMSFHLNSPEKIQIDMR